MKLHQLFLIIVIGLSMASCESEEEDPRAIFFASYTGEEFCMNGANYVSTISASANVNEVLWTNFLAEDGAEDDVIAQVTGNSIIVERQSVGGNLEAGGTGTLLNDGTIDFTMTVYAGPIAVSCAIDFTPN